MLKCCDLPILLKPSLLEDTKKANVKTLALIVNYSSSLMEFGIFM